MPMPKSKSRKNKPSKRVLALPDLERARQRSVCPAGLFARSPTPIDRLVPEEGVLHASLPMVARFLLPLSLSAMEERWDV
jgi:hypothetical protein